jgi:hypothetical protein
VTPYLSDRNIFDSEFLTVRQHVSLDDEPYQFDERIIAKHKDGRWFTARDSGCSCPVPFEDFQKLEDLTQIGLNASYRAPTLADGASLFDWYTRYKATNDPKYKRYMIQVRTSWGELIAEAEAVLATCQGTATDRFYGTPPEASTIAHYIDWLKRQRREIRRARRAS